MLENTKTKVGPEALKSVYKGVFSIYDVVRRTLGPAGVNGSIPRSYNRGSRITNDGYANSEVILPKDPFARQIAESFKEMARKTNILSGDGTTTTTVLGGYLTLQEMKKLLQDDIPALGISSSKINPRITRGLLKASKDVVLSKIDEEAKKNKIESLEDLEKIAITSIGKEDEEVAKQVAKFVWEIARDDEGNFVNNHIDIVEGYKGKVEFEQIKGMKFPAKAIRGFLTVPEKFEMVAEDVPVLITNYKLDNVGEIVSALNPLKLNKIAIFAPDFSDQVLISFANSWKNGVFVYPVKCPSLRTEQLEDLAAFTAATVIDKDKGMKVKNVGQDHLGFAGKIVVKDTENREDAVLLGGRGEKLVAAEDGKTPIVHRIEILKGQLEEARDEFTRVSLQKRIANLYSAVGIIRVGSSTDNENHYLKLKIEDGQYACKAALEEGYVRGGGLCLKSIAESLPEGDLLKEALTEPYNQIQENAGGNLEIGEDVIDPAKSVRLEVEHAVSIASTLITIGIITVEESEKSPAEGYEAIANAILRYAKYYAREKGLLKESEDMAEEDRQKVFEKILAEDNG